MHEMPYEEQTLTLQTYSEEKRARVRQMWARLPILAGVGL